MHRYSVIKMHGEVLSVLNEYTLLHMFLNLTLSLSLYIFFNIHISIVVHVHVSEPVIPDVDQYLLNTEINSII